MTSYTGAIVIACVTLSITSRATDGQCQFPEFLRRPKPSPPSPDPWFWTTEAKYQLSSSVLESQLEMHILEGVMNVKVKFKDECDVAESNEICYQKEFRYQRKCLSEKNGLFHVLHVENGNPTGSTLVCMKFVQRNANVVQVFQGTLDDEQSVNDCSENILQRDEWPWIASIQLEWSFCPINGGYDFRASVNKNTELCPDEWRPSRFESECVQGESMRFVFPSPDCSPFVDKRLETTLNCWANWEEDGILFIVASFPGAHPQFVLRLQSGPMDPVTTRISWYFSPICPITKRGTPTAGVTFPLKILDLAANRSESGLCYDDSSLCSDHSMAGRCFNTALYQYANYCKRSCGLCNVLPSARSECRFPPEFQGEWYFLESDRKERVSISPENISFSVLGDFICKSKHWSINYYKLFSVYSNGCRPRYTCLHLEQENEDVLRFQISSSSVVDQSFDLCQFKDDDLPLGNRIHSAQTKILISDLRVQNNTCGLHGQVSVSTQPDSERRSCSGVMTDWIDQFCGHVARLRLRLSGKCQYTENASSTVAVQQEFICSSFIQLDPRHSLLITKTSTLPETFLCWAIKTYSSSTSGSAWHEVYLLATAQCGTIKDFDSKALAKAKLALSTRGDRLNRPCGSTIATSKLKSTITDPTRNSEFKKRPKSADFQNPFNIDKNDAGRTEKLSENPQNGKNSVRGLSPLVHLTFWENTVFTMALYKSSRLCLTD